jgi:amidase
MIQKPSESICALLSQIAASPRRLRDLHLASQTAIQRWNPSVNAICTHRAENQIEATIEEIINRLINNKPVGMLAGMPYVAKDIHATSGLKTTRGSTLFKDWLPSHNDTVVQRYLDSDALLIGKSNTPEFAAGSQTFNPLFGATSNPYDASKTVGGSSGGSAAALATGMAILADGSDLAASLRNPAAFCGVVGMRGSSRTDPVLATGLNRFDSLSIVGPMACSVDNLRISNRAIFGDPQQREKRPIQHWIEEFDNDAHRRAAENPRILKIAYSVDGGGTFPVEEAVKKQLLKCITVLKAQGHDVVEASPNFQGADDCFQTLRGLYFVESFGELYQAHKSALKDTIVWNIEQGLALSSSAIATANRVRSEIFSRCFEFMAPIDAWLLPTSQVLPFSINDPYPKTINGEALTTYIDWLKSCYWITVSGHPAISIPCGLAQGLPVGLQIVGHWMQDERLINTAEQIETAIESLQT